MVQLIQHLDYACMTDYVLRILLRLQQRVSATPGTSFPDTRVRIVKTSAKHRVKKRKPHGHSFSNAVAVMRCLLTRKAASLMEQRRRSGDAASEWNTAVRVCTCVAAWLRACAQVETVMLWNGQLFLPLGWLCLLSGRNLIEPVFILS